MAVLASAHDDRDLLTAGYCTDRVPQRRAAAFPAVGVRGGPGRGGVCAPGCGRGDRGDVGRGVAGRGGDVGGPAPKGWARDRAGRQGGACRGGAGEAGSGYAARVRLGAWRAALLGSATVLPYFAIRGETRVEGARDGGLHGCRSLHGC